MFTRIKQWLTRLMLKEVVVNRYCKKIYFDELNDVVWEVDTKLNIVTINKAIEKYGWCVGDLIGKNVSLICPPETMEMCFNAIEKYINDPVKYNKQKFRVICRHNHPTKTYNAEVNVSVIKDKGKVVGYSGVSRDIDNQLIIESLKKENGLFKGIYTFCHGLCNELTQPLQAMYGHISIIKLLDLNKEEDRERLMLEIAKLLKQLNRITDLIKSIQRARSNRLDENVINEILISHSKPYKAKQLK